MPEKRPGRHRHDLHYTKHPSSWESVPFPAPPGLVAAEASIFQATELRATSVLQCHRQQQVGGQQGLTRFVQESPLWFVSGQYFDALPSQRRRKILCVGRCSRTSHDDARGLAHLRDDAIHLRRIIQVRSKRSHQQGGGERRTRLGHWEVLIVFIGHLQRRATQRVWCSPRVQ